ncbi:TIGR04053 family radical SAM/SPASM domain-containing protein [Propionibacteriaceae bacterium G57]|uniref:TIGR04053 family radical SAM/SPASM domain-containing protein n=1 Tax=Aestuariimicrobium sp. G57 TaxID=3418485 RepID=UPI003DA743BD
MSTTEQATTTRTTPVVRMGHYDPHDRPFIVIWEVTRACALVCKHCRADAQHRAHPDQLTTAQGVELLDEIAAFGRPQPIVVLTGGDPFERADLTDLVRHGTNLGLAMSVSPSVTPKLTRERVAALHDAGGKAMSVSLDGARAATHDAFRGIDGTFARTVEAAAMIMDEGFRLQVNTTITRHNVRELPLLLADVIGMGAKMWYLFFLVPTGRGAQLSSLHPDEKEDVLHWLHDVSDRIAIKTTEAPQYRRVALQRDAWRRDGVPMPQRGELWHWLTAETTRLLGAAPDRPRVPRAPMAVNSGNGFAFIDHIGDVYPSGFLPYVCGNVTRESFRDIYRNADMMRQLRRPDEFGGKCGVCEFNTVCGGSRSHAHAVTGDPLAADPTCPYIPAGWAN